MAPQERSAQAGVLLQLPCTRGKPSLPLLWLRLVTTCKHLLAMPRAASSTGATTRCKPYPAATHILLEAAVIHLLAILGAAAPPAAPPIMRLRVQVTRRRRQAAVHLRSKWPVTAGGWLRCNKRVEWTSTLDAWQCTWLLGSRSQA